MGYNLINAPNYYLKAYPFYYFGIHGKHKITYLILGLKFNFIETIQVTCGSKFHSNKKASTGHPNCGMGRWSVCTSLDWCVGEDGNSWVSRVPEKCCRCSLTPATARPRPFSEH